MAKKAKMETMDYRFKKGVNLADDSRFEAGDAVPDTLTKEQVDVLFELDAIEIAGDAD